MFQPVRLLCLVLCIMAGNHATILAEDCKPANTPSYPDFRIGIYLAADSHPQNLQLSRMIADWAGHGINTVVIRRDIYYNLAPQGLHSLAKQWEIELIIGVHFGPASEPRKKMRELIRRVNSYPDSDAVKAWYAADEFEGCYTRQVGPDTERVWREFVSMIKAEDPNREVIVNHDARTDAWGGRFAELGEDESWCSVFWANHYAIDFLRKTMATHRKAYGDVCPPLTFVYGAQSTNKAGSAKDYEQHGISGVTLQQLKQISTREDIADYILTAKKVGASGAVFFCYDGYYDFRYYTLVDERGRSVEEKMEGIRDAAEQIARLEGRPGLQMKFQANTLLINTLTSSTGQAVKQITVQISDDGGYTWQTIPGLGPTGGTVDCGYDDHRNILRARCYDDRSYSLWSVGNTFPWAAPRPHE